jgi:hypothetical protein
MEIISLIHVVPPELSQLDPIHRDARGIIVSILNTPISNVSIIESCEGTFRSNHYHKTDWHVMYTLTGAYNYYARRVGDKSALQCRRINKGEILFTGVMEEHLCEFLEDTTLLVLSKNPRDQASYESDVVRLDLISEI